MTPVQHMLATMVRTRLREKGWSQQALAEAAGYSPAHVSHMLTGGTEGTLSAWQRLLDALDEDADVSPRSTPS